MTKLAWEPKSDAEAWALQVCTGPPDAAELVAGLPHARRVKTLLCSLIHQRLSGDFQEREEVVRWGQVPGAGLSIMGFPPKTL